MKVRPMWARCEEWGSDHACTPYQDLNLALRPLKHPQLR